MTAFNVIPKGVDYLPSGETLTIHWGWLQGIALLILCPSSSLGSQDWRGLFPVAFPFCAMYVVALIGNITLLHGPELTPPCMSPCTSLSGHAGYHWLWSSSTSTQPKMPAISPALLTVRLNTMPASSSCSSSMPSEVRIAHGYGLGPDMAICFPLYHSSILTPCVM